MSDKTNAAINAMINKPHSTVKILMPCFVVLLVAASIYGVNVLRDWSTSYSDTAVYPKTIEAIKNNAIMGGKAISNIDLTTVIVHPEKEEVVSENDSYTFPEGYDPDDPVAMGEVDPYAAMEPDVDEIMKQEAMDAWAEYNEPEPDLSDRIVKP